MGMTQENSTWQNKIEVKKGAIGERLVREYFLKQGIFLYSPPKEGVAHVFDYFAYKDGKILYAVEVKTKPACSKYPETGFDYKHYERYKENCEETKIRLFCIWVDEKKKEIYGNFLDVLDKKLKVERMQYPKIRTMTGGKGRLVYFPLTSMEHLDDIDDATALEIRKCYTGKYENWGKNINE